MGTLKRKDLKPKRELSDEQFLRYAQAMATRQANRAARGQRVELLEAELKRQERRLRPPAKTGS